MKHSRFNLRIAVLTLTLALALLLLTEGTALASGMSSAQKEKTYVTAINALEAFLETRDPDNVLTLNGLKREFDSLLGYKKSAEFSSYVTVLISIAEGAFGYSAELELEMLTSDTDFQKYLESNLDGSPICDANRLKAYYEARKTEYESGAETAADMYRECGSYFDAQIRYRSIRQETDRQTYDRALAYLESGEFVAAYFSFRECNGYSDSDKRMQGIIEHLGYAPENENDVPGSVSGLRASATTETSVSLAWDSAAHATAYRVEWRVSGASSWTVAGSVSGTAADMKRLTESVSYDFRVTAITGKYETEPAELSGVITAAPTPAPTPVPENTHTLVYATDGGIYFHTDSSCSGMTGAAQLTLDSAVSKGKIPCPLCVTPANLYVFATLNGTYYHTVYNCSGMKNASYIVASNAIKLGKTACQMCGARALRFDPGTIPTQTPTPAPTPRPTLTPAPKPAFKAGQSVKLGSYEQDNNTKNGKEPIEWIVLNVESDGTCLLISKYALDCRPYNAQLKNVTWEMSALRSWLGNEFYNAAFSSAERAKIVPTSRPNADNPAFGTYGGSETTDYVFLLSLEDIEKYFRINRDTQPNGYWDGEDRLVKRPTAYAKAQGAATAANGACRWWLTTPGSGSDHAVSVDSDGRAILRGNSVNTGLYCVVPAVRVLFY
ncbi:MAG: fibronectin type III domain-containing protein [Clostridia bacterium]|nr:fibronectin type III domain-containing protein [Clostridia bacterium]